MTTCNEQLQFRWASPKKGRREQSLEGRVQCSQADTSPAREGISMRKGWKARKEVSVEGTTAIGSGKLGSVGGRAGEGGSQMIKP